MRIFIILLLECISGFILFSKVMLDSRSSKSIENKVSVIIPARNEETNLPYLLDSLNKQTFTPHEIIVVDDFSSDRTVSIAEQYSATVIKNTELPPGWTGKTWAVWNGYLKSSGDVLVFLDADVRLAPDGLEAILKTRERTGGVISVVPYHRTEKFYERLSLILYLLGVFAFTSPFERKNKEKGVYGSCIAALREDYEKINGHVSIKSELLDDINLGKKLSQAGVKVTNFIGCRYVYFRMYPNGIKSELQGFGKGAVLSTSTLRPGTIALIALWVVGLLASGIGAPVLLAVHSPWFIPFVGGYIIYALQIFYFLRYTGKYGLVVPLLHFLPSLFFIAVILYSIYQVAFLGSVSWKGRQIKVGGKRQS